MEKIKTGKDNTEHVYVFKNYKLQRIDKMTLVKNYYSY